MTKLNKLDKKGLACTQVPSTHNVCRFRGNQLQSVKAVSMWVISTVENENWCYSMLLLINYSFRLSLSQVAISSF